MNRNIAIGSAVLVAVAAAAGAAAWVHYAPILRAQEVVRSALKDPDSARFDQVRVYTRHKAVCGLVNAKNSMGGYAGFAQFILFDDGDLRLQPSGGEPSYAEPQFRALVESNCRD